MKTKKINASTIKHCILYKILKKNQQMKWDFFFKILNLKTNIKTRYIPRYIQKKLKPYTKQTNMIANLFLRRSFISFTEHTIRSNIRYTYYLLCGWSLFLNYVYVKRMNDGILWDLDYMVLSYMQHIHFMLQSYVYMLS